MKRFFILALCLCLSVSPALAGSMTLLGVGAPVVSGGGGSCVSTQGNNFLARTSGLDGTHTTAYCTMIDGLVSDGVWAKLDALYIFATNSSANAILNLIGNSNNAVNHSATFTANAGFNGNGSSTYVDTTVDPTATVQYTQNSAHFSVWGNSTSPSASGGRAGYLDGGATKGTYIGIGDAGSTSLGGINNAFGRDLNSSGVGNQKNHILINRSASNARQLYISGSSAASDALVSSTIPTGITFWVGCRNFGSSTNACTDAQFMMASVGASLNSGSDAANFYARVHAYLQTIAGIP
jgi:hypothetical protein